MESNDSQEDKENGPEVQISIPESVLSRIDEVMGDNERFDTQDFDPIAYINNLFPTEQSLLGAEAAAARVEWRLAELARQLARCVPSAERRARGQAELKAAREKQRELAQQVSTIVAGAQAAERGVALVTREMKQLDRAKRALGGAAAALARCRLLAAAARALQAAAAARRYGDALQPLQAVGEVLEQLSTYDDIPAVRALRDTAAAARAQLQEHAEHDFKEAFSGAAKPANLAELCACAAALDPALQARLLGWLAARTLAEYRAVFGAGEPGARLEAVEARYAWLRRALLAAERTLPPAWGLSRVVAESFCQITHDQLSELMSSQREQLDVKVLLEALQRTRHFETLLHRRFEGELTEAEGSGDTPAEGADESAGGHPPSPWLGAVSRAFEPHLGLFVSTLDASIQSLVDKIVEESKSQPAPDPAAVFPSCGELFLLYKRCLLQCTPLTRGEPIVKLAAVFGKHLRAYCTRVLLPALPDTNNRLTPAELARACSALLTAEYCLETTAHLERKLREKCAPALAPRAALRAESDALHRAKESAVAVVLKDWQLATEASLAGMRRGAWARAAAVGDASPHCAELARRLTPAVRDAQAHLQPARKYFTALLLRLAGWLAPLLTQLVLRARPLSAAGAEQCLLDLHTMKTSLLALPAGPAPAAYARLLGRQLARVEMLVKLAMQPLSVDQLVEQTALLMPDASGADLARVLELRGAAVPRAQLQRLQDRLQEIVDKPREE